MKRIVCILLCLLLCGCSNNKDINASLDAIFDNATTTNNRANNYTNYIEYYLPSDVTEYGSEPLSYSFNIDGCNFVMNVNVANIINNVYYPTNELKGESFFDEDKLFYSHTGEFTNLNDEKIKYLFKLYKYEDKYIEYFVSDEINIYGYCSLDKVDLLASKIMQMAMACNVNNDKVVTDFSSMEVVDYQKSPVDLFGVIMPKDGRIDEMMVPEQQQVSQQ